LLFLGCRDLVKEPVAEHSMIAELAAVLAWCCMYS
jgi:hypothetical protein